MRYSHFLNPRLLTLGASEAYKRKSDAAKRAENRLLEKMKRNRSIPSGERVTRQQVRYARRCALKELRSARKQAAMEMQLPGGAAVIH